jgi:hypothetical protein
MGNPYRDMKDIKLTCHLVRDFEEIFGCSSLAEKFDIEINSSDYVDSLKDKIYEVIKQKNNIFSDIKADDLMLWKVQIPNDGGSSYFLSRWALPFFPKKTWMKNMRIFCLE